MLNGSTGVSLDRRARLVVLLACCLLVVHANNELLENEDLNGGERLFERDTNYACVNCTLMF
jgi:hypothetical protein